MQKMNMQKRLPFYRSLDNAPRPFKCTVCPQAFKQKGHLHQHMRIHTGVKPYRCDLCGYASTIRGNLTAHIKLRHSNNNNKLRKFRCPHCGLYFKFFDSLTVHISNRHALNVLPKEGQSTDAEVMTSQPQMIQQSESVSVTARRMQMSLPPMHAQQVMPQFPLEFNPQSIPTSSYSMQPILPQGTTHTDSSANLQDEIQQWEVIGNANIEAREVISNANIEARVIGNVNIEAGGDTQPVENSTESAMSNEAASQVPVEIVEHSTQQMKMKEEDQRLPPCEHEQDRSEEQLSASQNIHVPATIGFSPASIQQRLLYSSNLSKTSYREKSSQSKVAETSTSNIQNDGVDTNIQMPADSGIGACIFPSDDDPNSTGQQQNKEDTTSCSQSQASTQDHIPNTSTESNSHTDVIYFDKSASISQMNIKATQSGNRTITSSPSSRVTASDMPAPVSNSFGVRCPTPISPMSHHSVSSPGVHSVHTYNHHVPSPSTSNIPASPSRKSANKKTKFQNKDSLQCEFCDIVFGDRVMHTIHMGWHSHHHPFQCGVCGQQCKDKYDFMCHFTRGHEC